MLSKINTSPTHEGGPRTRNASLNQGRIPMAKASIGESQWPNASLNQGRVLMAKCVPQLKLRSNELHKPRSTSRPNGHARVSVSIASQWPNASLN